MIEKFIELIKKCNSYMENKTRTLESNLTLITLLQKIKDNEVLSKEELESFYSDMERNNQRIDDNTKKRFSFISFLLQNEIELDEEQKEIYSSVCDVASDTLAKNDVSKITSYREFIAKNKELIEELNNGLHFESFDKIVFAFDEIGNLDIAEVSLSNEDKLNILRALIDENANRAVEGRFEEQTEPEVEEPVETIAPVQAETEEVILSNDTLRVLFTRFDYNYDLLSKDEKDYIIEYGNSSNIRQIFEAMQNNDIRIELDSDKKIMTLCKILVISNASVINTFAQICDENNINKKDYIDHFANVLIPKGKIKNKPLVVEGTNPIGGLFDNFKGSVEFLKEQGFSIENIAKKTKTIFSSNPEILKSNLMIMENIYGIKMNRENDAFTTIVAQDTIKNIDRFIESSDLGYEYILKSKSRLYLSNDTTFLQIRVAEQYGKSLFTRQQNGSIAKFDARKSDVSETDPRLGIMTESKENLERKFNLSSLLLPIEKTKALESIDVKQVTKINDEIFSNPYIKLLDSSFMTADYLYKINGTRVSRLKVLRVCQSLMEAQIPITDIEIKYALGYDSLLNAKDVYNINNFTLFSNYTIENGGIRLNG